MKGSLPRILLFLHEDRIRVEECQRAQKQHVASVAMEGRVGEMPASVPRGKQERLRLG